MILIMCCLYSTVLKTSNISIASCSKSRPAADPFCLTSQSAQLTLPPHENILLSGALIFSHNLPSSPLTPSFLFHHQSYKCATVHSHFSFCTCQLCALQQSPLPQTNPAKQALTTRLPKGELHAQLGTRRLPSHAAGTLPRPRTKEQVKRS